MYLLGWVKLITSTISGLFSAFLVVCRFSLLHKLCDSESNQKGEKKKGKKRKEKKRKKGHVRDMNQVGLFSLH